ncbi:hypothetical protein FS842_003218 [Serendipita sp. 407]|nr:hypothetical protein FS842_003218 [Serendipita sp. 407]
MAFCTHWLCLSQSPLNLSSIGPHSSAYGLFVFRPFFSLDLHFETTPTLMFLHSRRSLITNPTPTPTGPLPFSGASSQRISRSPSLQAPFACSSGPLLDFFSPTLDAGASNTQLLFDYLKKGVVTPVYFVVFRFSLFFFPFPPSSFLFPMQQHMIHAKPPHLLACTSQLFSPLNGLGKKKNTHNHAMRVDECCDGHRSTTAAIGCTVSLSLLPLRVVSCTYVHPFFRLQFLDTSALSNSHSPAFGTSFSIVFWSQLHLFHTNKHHHILINRNLIFHHICIPLIIIIIIFTFPFSFFSLVRFLFPFLFLFPCRRVLYTYSRTPFSDPSSL